MIFITLFLCHATVNAQFYKKVDPITGHVTLINFSDDSSKNIEKKSETAIVEKKIKIQNDTKRKNVVVQKNDSFPVVTSSEQKSRDIDRRGILSDELENEKKILSSKISNKSDQTDISRVKSNIASLEREILSIK